MEKPESKTIEALGLLALGQYMRGNDVVLDPVHLPDDEPYAAIRAAYAECRDYWRRGLSAADFMLVIQGRTPSDLEARRRIKDLKRAVAAARSAAQTRYREYLMARNPRHRLNEERLAKAQAMAEHLMIVPGFHAVYLFGSVARGQDTADSDIDLYIQRSGLWNHVPWDRAESLLRPAFPPESTVRDVTHVTWLGEQFQLLAGGGLPARKNLEDATLLTSLNGAVVFGAHRTHPEVWAGSNEALWMAFTQSYGAEDYRGVGEWWNGQRILGFQWMAKYGKGDDVPAKGTMRCLNKTGPVPEMLWELLSQMPRPASPRLGLMHQWLETGEQRTF